MKLPSPRHEGHVLRPAPIGNHFLTQFRHVAVQPAQVVAHPGARGVALGQHGVELAGGVPADVPRPGEHLLEKPFGRQVDIVSAEVVPGRLQLLEDVRERLGDVQVAGPYAGLSRRVVVEEDRHPLVGVRDGAERRVTQRPPYGQRDARGDRLTGDDGQPRVRIRAALLAPYHRRRDQPRQLRHGDLERPLEHGQSLSRRPPLGLAPPVEADQAQDRNIELPQRLAGVGTGEAEQERQRGVRPRRPVRIAEQGLESDAGRIAEDRDRFGALPLDLLDDRIDERGVSVVVARSVEAHRHARRARPLLAGGPPPGVERIPVGKRSAPRSGAACRARRVRIVVAGLQARLRLRHLQARHAGRRQHVLEQSYLVRETRVLPERTRATVPGHPAFDVVLPRLQTLADAEHEPPTGDPFDQIDVVSGVEALERVRVVDVQNEHVAAQHLLGIDRVEQRFGYQSDRDALTQLGTLVEHRPPGAQDAGQRGVAGEIREPDLLRRGRTGRGDRQQGAADRDPQEPADASAAGRTTPHIRSRVFHAAPLSRARRRSVRRPGDRRCRGVRPARRVSRRSARTP